MNPAAQYACLRFTIKNKVPMMALQEIEAPWKLDEAPLPPEIDAWIALSRREIEEFWDRSRKTKKTIYVECDFRHVAETLLQCLQSDMLRGLRFVEWGCGFGIVTGIADLLGMQAVGIESESFLVAEGQRLHRRAGLSCQLWHGNFLPDGAADLALPDDPRVALTIAMPPVYAGHDPALQEFDAIFCYAWPGEEHFLKQVFNRYAGLQSMLVLYRGPYQVELFRKRS